VVNLQLECSWEGCVGVGPLHGGERGGGVQHTHWFVKGEK